MNEIDTIRAKSKYSAKIIVAEFAYCTILFFAYKVYLMPSKAVSVVYIILLLAFPLALNFYIYLKSIKISDFILASHAAITQILILVFSFKFLIKIPCFE